MSKAFTRETDQEDDEVQTGVPALPKGFKNYITPSGLKALKDEYLELIDKERPKIVSIVSWAASNGDRSENGDYIYGKRRLREIDRRLRFLLKRIESAEEFDPSIHHGKDQIFFGATVTYAREDGEENTITIVGIDEFDPLKGRISWISPMARTLIKAREGDVVTLNTPNGFEELEILEVRYPSPRR
jgi:transcription elongation factor GreB